jgi:hypothetical protein
VLLSMNACGLDDYKEDRLHVGWMIIKRTGIRTMRRTVMSEMCTAEVPRWHSPGCCECGQYSWLMATGVPTPSSLMSTKLMFLTAPRPP